MLKLSENAIKYPKQWFWIAGIICLTLLTLVAAPTIAPNNFQFLHPLHIDTDPENMLSNNEPVRVFHNAMKKEFSLSDIIVVGIINNKNPHGVFNTKTLSEIYELTDYAKNFIYEKNKNEGIIKIDIIAPSNVDNIEQGGLGTVNFKWLMKSPPSTDKEAEEIAKKAARIPFLNNTLISDDKKAIALYIPITSKDISYDVAKKLREKIDGFKSEAQYHITGLPVAQDQFGVEMFKQMAISAPIAMLLIFLLMWYFFKNIKIILAPMLIAMISVIITMGLLIITGNTVHIMSSMIPIFIMPIAVLDAVHILSDFFDRYQKTRNREKTLRHVMEELWQPMLYTSLTTCAGFISLAFTPIPPVQIFGIFVALGVAFAWILTVTLIPAYIILMKEESFKNFGMRHDKDLDKTPFAAFIHSIGKFSFNHAKLVLLGTFILSVVAYYGITQIQINDNPVKWFEKSHPIRIADRELNKRFAGTYMAYLTLSSPKDFKIEITNQDIKELNNEVRNDLANFISREKSIDKIKNYIISKQDEASDNNIWDEWDKALNLIGEKEQQSETFKNPEVLKYIEKLQNYLITTGNVGKSNSLADIVKTIHRDLLLGNEAEYKIPETSAAIAQTLITYQGSHRPQDLWHFVTPDYRQTLIWLQLKSGDNKDMQKVVEEVSDYFKQNPAPLNITHNWSGLTYINVIWQNKMVKGMLESFGSSFIIVLLMMMFLFKSPLWGLLSMVPLTVTIAFIYGIIGIIGKDYDMPVAVLSSLSLGLAVDYAIHFLARSKELRKENSNWQETIHQVFGEPGRAIARNVIVVGIGFLPLLAAPLVPYKTVGIFISSILLFAGIASLIILPALITLLEKKLFKDIGEK